MAAGVLNIVIWPRFGMAIYKDDRAWSGSVGSSAPTAFLWVHAVLISVAVVAALGVLAIGVRAARAGSARRR